MFWNKEGVMDALSIGRQKLLLSNKVCNLSGNYALFDTATLPRFNNLPVYLIK